MPPPSSARTRLLQFPPYGSYLPEIQNFDQVGTVSVPGGGAATLVTYQLRPRTRGVLLFFGQSVLDSDAWASLTWRVTVDDSTVEGLSWTTRVGGIATPAPVYLTLGPRQTVRVQAANAAVGAFDACARVKGYFWPHENELLGPPEGGPR